MKHYVECLRKQDGAVALEFAVVAPVLFMLLIGIVQFGWIIALQSVLDSATAETARHYKALSRSASSGMNSANINQIRDQIMQVAGNTIDKSKLKVYANWLGHGSGWGSAGGSSNSQNAGNCGGGSYRSSSCSGFTSDVVQYQVEYDYEFQPPLAWLFPKRNGKSYITLRSSTVVQNEPDI